MCIVIDTNRLSSVLNPKASDHGEFRPILDWIDRRKTKIVYGGTKYKEELSKAPKYFSTLVEMKKAGKVHEVDDGEVDRWENEIARKTQHTNFNDQAIVAIVIVSRCRLVCSNDQASFSFIRLKTLYPNGVSRPSIYTGRRNVALLNHKHIKGRCGPCSTC